MRILLDTHILLWVLSVEIKHLAHPDIMPVSAEEISGYCEQSGYKQITIFVGDIS